MIRTIIVLSIVFIFNASMATAQTGWFLGANITDGITLNYNTTSKTGGKLGSYFSAGFTAEYMFNEHVRITTGCAYANYRYNILFHNPKEVIDHQKQRFAEVPILLTLGKHYTKRDWAYFNLGFAATICVNASYDLEYTSGNKPNESGTNLTDFKATPVRFVMDVGVQHHLIKSWYANLGVKLGSGLNDNMTGIPKVVNFVPGSLSALGVELGVRRKL